MKKKIFLLASLLFTISACSSTSNSASSENKTTSSGQTSETPKNTTSSESSKLTTSSSKDETSSSSKQTSSSPISSSSSQDSSSSSSSSQNKPAMPSSVTLNKDTLSVSYDGKDHYGDITVVGKPEDATITKEVYKNGTLVTECIDVGTYQLNFTVSHPDYLDLSLSAILKITAVKDDMPLLALNSKIYFSNGLDANQIYTYDKSETSKPINNISYNSAKQIIKYGQKSLVLAKSLLGTSIKTIDKNGNIDTHYYDPSIDCITTDGNNIYFATNYLTNEKSGIYKLVESDTDDSDTSNDSVTAKLLYSGKVKYLTYANNKLYFADGRNDDKLSYISANITTSTSTATALSLDGNEEKIKYMIADGNNLYFNIDNLTGDYLCKYNTSTSTKTKLTTSCGEYLTIAGDYIYFANIDLVNSNVFGKGIYKVKTDGSEKTTAGTIVVPATYSINSLCYEDDHLYFIDGADLHLKDYDISSSTVTDLLASFVIPEHPFHNKGGQQQEINGKIYYLNMQRGKTLCVYDPEKKTNSQLTTEKVANFSVIGDYIYLNTVTYFVNNDLYRFNYKTGGYLEKISSDDASEIVGDDNFIYYAKDNAAGAATSIERINLATEEQTQIYSKGVSNLRLIDDNLYCEDGGKVLKFDVSDTTKTTYTKTEIENLKHVDYFEIENNQIYYSYTNIGSNSLRRATITNNSADDEIKLAETKVDPIEMQIVGSKIYFLSDTAIASDDGLYVINNKATTNPNTHSLVISDSNIQDMYIYNNYLYYLSSGWESLTGDSHIYQQSLTNLDEEPVRIDVEGF